MRKKFSQKRKALYSSIYIPKANIILQDENNSVILKQKKKIDKLDNDNKIMDQKKMKLYSRWSRTRYTIWF